MHLVLFQWAILALASFGVGLSKTGIAGFGIVAVALFAVAVPAKESIGIILPLLICGDICAVSIYRRKAVWSHLFGLLPWAVVGLAFGFFALGHINSSQVGRLIGAILLALMILQILRKLQASKLHKTDSAQQPDSVRHAPIVEAATGILAGSTTMIANAAGPVMVLYLLAANLPKVEFVGTGAWFFFVVNLIKLPLQAKLGLLNGYSLKLDLILLPFVLVGAFVGRIIVQIIDQKQFETTAMLLTVLAAVKLIVG